MTKIRTIMMIKHVDLGGAESQMAKLITGLDRTRFDVTVCLFMDFGYFIKVYRDSGIPVHVVPKRTKYDVLHMARLTAWLRRMKPHVVHTWITEANSIGTVAAALSRVPVRISYVLNVCDWKTRARLLYDRMAMGCCHCVATNSVRINAFLAERMKLDPLKIRTIYNGVDPERYRLDAGERQAARREVREAFGIPGGARLFITVARMRPKKNHLGYLEDIARLPPDPGMHFLFVGDGETEPQVRARARMLRLEERVHFAGLCPDIVRLLAAADVFVLPSQNEGLSNAILEAMASGLPVVATDVGGNPEAVDHGRTGFIVPPAGGPELVDAIVGLGRDPQLRRRMGDEGRRRVEIHFNDRKTTEAFEALYEEMLERGAASTASLRRGAA